MSRRSPPKLMRSDNGSNFTAGDKELKAGIQQWNQKKIAEHMAQKDVEWKFNPPSASHMGGMWERLIRSLRSALNSLSRLQTLTDESLATFVAETERILNDRPLTEVSDDIEDLEPLTPNHVLLAQRKHCFAPGVFVKEDGLLRRRWRQAQYLTDLFWKRWLKEYLPTLRERQKWLQTQKNLKTGDLVLVSMDTARGDWPLGRIVNTYPDSSGLVRSVDVQTAGPLLKRPVTSLCLLERDIERLS